jgi:hypothetical protein
MTRYIVVVPTLAVLGVPSVNRVIVFKDFGTAYHYLLMHGTAEMFQIPESGIGPCENLSREPIDPDNPFTV